MNTLYNKSLISITDLTTSDIELIFKTAAQFKKTPNQKTLQNKIIAHCFFEPSTRTRLSFESATLRSGGHVIGFSNDRGISLQKGETLYDTIKVVSAYADLIVIRHSSEGAAKLATEAANCPIINAGDGSNQHPTQALLDLFTIKTSHEKIDGLSIALVGDLKYGRTIHSFTQLCALYDIRLYLVSPKSLTLPDDICNSLKKRGVRFSFHEELEEVIPKVDVIYSTRIQKERFSEAEYQLVKNQFILTPSQLTKAKSNLKILHPLPRVNEISKSVDATPFAYYFEQAANGVPIRQALLSLILNEDLT